ncbi:XRN 5'-3' exonuclease N-terminus family protein [Histomonas meleagridis]|uniref:XRN 5'-3' exonuclease N-terminus family protein n=1 Tax=Histomonas meleagridis TaxID=135588 RepID=UPI003559F678|nr:XRN 5'-3' exonuclease N-terminus family protein [Histomonas meleagridis]KAH0804994.1 XRN 5'-3' exonuclease N-terminus family protein [Histomonas meleagridis]
MDGPSPFAKTTLQRKRKLEREFQKNFQIPDHIDFSPDWQFPKTHRLLLEHFKKMASTDPSFPKFILTAGQTSGEGEFQFMDILRSESSKPDFNPYQEILIQSSDNDLFFLALQTHLPNITIVRSIGNTETFFSIKYLRLALFEEFSPRDPDRIIDDIVFLSFLISNDNLPAFPDISGSITSLSQLFNIYRDHQEIGYLTENGKIIRTNLKKLVEAYIATKPASFVSVQTRQFISDEPLEILAKDCLRTLSWILLYYQEGVPDWTWSYAHQKAPPLCLTVEYIDTFDDTFSIGEPITPYFKGLAIHSIFAVQNIPEPIYRLKATVLSDLYPLEKVTPPIAPYSRLRSAYDKALKQLTPEEASYNQLDPFWTYDPSTKDLIPFPITPGNKFTNKANILYGQFFLLDVPPISIMRHNFILDNTLRSKCKCSFADLRKRVSSTGITKGNMVAAGLVEVKTVIKDEKTFYNYSYENDVANYVVEKKRFEGEIVMVPRMMRCIPYAQLSGLKMPKLDITVNLSVKHEKINAVELGMFVQEGANRLIGIVAGVDNENGTVLIAYGEGEFELVPLKYFWK